MKEPLPLIVVVDDEESVRKAVQRLLRPAGMNVKTFASGANFLDAVDLYPIDCVVLDLHLAGINGFEVQASLVRSSE